MDAVGGPMLRQMKQLGINAKFMGGDGICTEQLPSLAAGAIGAVGGVITGASFKLISREVIRHAWRSTLYNDQPFRFSANKSLY